MFLCNVYILGINVAKFIVIPFPEIHADTTASLSGLQQQGIIFKTTFISGFWINHITLQVHVVGPKLGIGFFYTVGIS